MRLIASDILGIHQSRNTCSAKLIIYIGTLIRPMLFFSISYRHASVANLYFAVVLISIETKSTSRDSINF